MDTKSTDPKQTATTGTAATATAAAAAIDTKTAPAPTATTTTTAAGSGGVPFPAPADLKSFSDAKWELAINKSDSCVVTRFGPGLVLIKNAFGVESQKWLARYAMGAGKDPKTGFWVNAGKDGKPILNATPSRGRIYQALSKYPEFDRIKQMCLDLVGMARTKAEALPAMNATHLLLLYYATADGMIWHK